MRDFSFNRPYSESSRSIGRKLSIAGFDPSSQLAIAAGSMEGNSTSQTRFRCSNVSPARRSGLTFPVSHRNTVFSDTFSNRANTVRDVASFAVLSQWMASRLVIRSFAILEEPRLGARCTEAVACMKYTSIPESYPNYNVCLYVCQCTSAFSARLLVLDFRSPYVLAFMSSESFPPSSRRRRRFPASSSENSRSAASAFQSATDFSRLPLAVNSPRPAVSRTPLARRANRDVLPLRKKAKVRRFAFGRERFPCPTETMPLSAAYPFAFINSALVGRRSYQCECWGCKRIRSLCRPLSRAGLRSLSDGWMIINGVCLALWGMLATIFTISRYDMGLIRWAKYY